MTTTTGWQPIETIPDEYKDGRPVLLGSVESEGRSAVSTLGWWQDAEEDGLDYRGADAGFVDCCYDVFRPGRSFGNPALQYEALQPTHWQPLPEPPQ